MTPQQKRELLAEADCNPRTLTRWLLGQPMKAPSKERLDDAARALGFYKFRGDKPQVKESRRGKTR